MDYFTDRMVAKKAVSKRLHVAKKTTDGVKAHRKQRKVARKGDKWYRESLGVTKEGLEKLHKRK